MEIRQLEWFRCILEEGSLTSAAKRCGISQPALTQQIQALEATIGEPLLIRKPRGVEATAAGKLLLEHAQRILAETDRAKEAFAGRRELVVGNIAFGIIPTIAPFLLPKMLGPFRKRFPAIELAITEGRTAELIDGLVKGSIEFAILSDVAAAERKRWSLQVRELFREPLLLAGPPDHRLLERKAPPGAADLDGAELIHLKGGHCLSDRTLRVCRIHDPNPGLRCDQLATAIAMSAAGLGVTVVPKLAAAMATAAGLSVRPFAGDGLHRVISLMRRKESGTSPAAAELLACFDRM